jgi:hypothetical protein
MVRRKLPEGEKKSRSKVMKDFRKKENNRKKIEEYETIRNQKRKLERLQKKLRKSLKMCSEKRWREDCRIASRRRG